MLRNHLHAKESYQLEPAEEASQNHSSSQTALVLPAPRETKIFKTASPSSNGRAAIQLQALHTNDQANNVFLAQANSSLSSKDVGTKVLPSSSGRIFSSWQRLKCSAATSSRCVKCRQYTHIHICTDSA